MKRAATAGMMLGGGGTGWEKEEGLEALAALVVGRMGTRREETCQHGPMRRWRPVRAAAGDEDV